MLTFFLCGVLVFVGILDIRFFLLAVPTTLSRTLGTSGISLKLANARERLLLTLMVWMPATMWLLLDALGNKLL